MGMDMIYIVGEEELSICLHSTDVEVMEALEKKSYQKEVEAILGVSDFDKETPVDRIFLLKAIDRLLEAVRNNSQILPYTYRLETQVSSNIGMLRSLCGMISGVRINKELYSIRSGLDKCDLIKKCQDEYGNWHDGERTDIRHLKNIKTDNMGEIVIHKRRKPTCLIRNLKKLKTFLSKTDVDIIRKILG